MIGLIADRLASEFAIQGNAPVRVVDLRISGINSVDGYGQVQQLLSETAIIELVCRED